MIEQLLQADRLLTVDQIPKARELYARVVELDPHNAIAVVGLARCALADGDDHGAYELAAKALLIDPENDMAARMEARLAEILSERGDPVERGEPVERAGARPDDEGATAWLPPEPTEMPTPARRSFLHRLRGR